jgi:2,4-dienoyl-CoA reductase-like NADH-dependent reductase (Old Yellow Enzyme family)
MTDQKLFTPFIFPSSGKEMNNRIALAPMTNLQSHDDGTLGDDEYKWLVRRAKENFGMIITCAANVSPDGKGWPGELGIFDDNHIEGLTRLANGIKEHCIGSDFSWWRAQSGKCNWTATMECECSYYANFQNSCRS